ncbi:MAG TPA: AAA family ATPase [Kofleriaceae bacterium]|nr:AAA family ATPase [Kofleriaceae bacterium]
MPVLEPFARDAKAVIDGLVTTIGQVIRGKDEAIRLALAALLARGHLLIEDVPGVGKTTLARAIAACLGGSFRRIQFTSDLMPADIVGVSIFNSTSRTFELSRGPIFGNVILADEINRTTPRTQSALLEAMSEGRVSIDDATHDLPRPFFVVATQNPVEHFGTYPLPESQMDRFVLCIRIGYPPPEDERTLLREQPSGDPVTVIEPAITADALFSLQDATERVHIADSLLDYVMAVVGETRASPALAAGVSTRGAMAWARVAQAVALSDGRDFCTPDDFKSLAVSALAHRVVIRDPGDAITGTHDDAARVIADIIDHTEVPI